MKPPRRLLMTLLLASAVALLYVSGPYYLPAVGSFLIKTDPLEEAEIVVVLAGDGSGHRIMKAVELVEQGYAPLVLVDGPLRHYDFSEAALAIEFAARRGAAREILEAFPIMASSTQSEAEMVDQELRRRGIRKALVVTSDFHTRRARNLFRKRTSGLVAYRVVAARYPGFHLESWWRSRFGLKVVFLEYIKTAASWLE